MCYQSVAVCKKSLRLLSKLQFLSSFKRTNSKLTAYQNATSSPSIPRYHCSALNPYSAHWCGVRVTSYYFACPSGAMGSGARIRLRHPRTAHRHWRASGWRAGVGSAGPACGRLAITSGEIENMFRYYLI